MKQKYIGVKLVEAEPMNAHDAAAAGHKVGDAEPEHLGFEVTYPDGYKSWCPEGPFYDANRPCNAMPFGHAIEAARQGNAIARRGWNGKGMFVVYMPELNLPPFNSQHTNRKVNDRTAKWIGEDAPLNSVPYFAMRAANGEWVPGWLASQTDMLSDDWMIVEDTVEWIRAAG